MGSENCDRDKWNNEDYEALKKTLNQFIPLIRFMEISSDDFCNKIKPYKDIIPNQIYKEIDDFYHNGTLPKTVTLPPRIGKLDSKIIKPKLAKIIINWMDKKDFLTSRYKFNLIYRGSIDGIGNQSFKNKCKGQIKSLVLIKVCPLRVETILIIFQFIFIIISIRQRSRIRKIIEIKTFKKRMI